MSSILVSFLLSYAYEVCLIHLLETEFSKLGRASFQPLVRIPHVMTQHGGETERERALCGEKEPHGYQSERDSRTCLALSHLV